jgi:peptidoglycan/xylan/chitin deacetylase (PgdA/CDA1 family)
VAPARVAYFAATVGLFAVPVWSLARAPLPLGLLLGLLLAYGALTTLGVLFLGLRMYVDAVVRGPRGARGVAITFDDGPHPVHTRAVLDALDARSVQGTFFVIGRKAEEHPELVREIVARGHAVGLHSYAHDRLFSLRSAAAVRRDLTRGLEVLEAITGERPRLFRPPIGHTSPLIARVVDELELTVVGWSVRARDGLAGTTAADVLRRVLPGAKDGAIVLLHDAAERGDRAPAGVGALPALLERLEAERVPVVPLEAFLRDA